MNRRIVLIAVAVVLALFGTFAVYSYAHNADERAVAGGRAVKVLIATKRVAGRHQLGRRGQERQPLRAEHAGLVRLRERADRPRRRHRPDRGRAERHRARARSCCARLSAPRRRTDRRARHSQGHDRDHGRPRQRRRRGRLRRAASKVIIFVTASSPSRTEPRQPATIGDDLTVTRTVVPTAPQSSRRRQAAPTNTVGKTAATARLVDGGSVLVTLALSPAGRRAGHQPADAAAHLGLLSATSVVHQDGGYVNAGVFNTDADLGQVEPTSTSLGGAERDHPVRTEQGHRSRRGAALDDSTGVRIVDNLTDAAAWVGYDADERLVVIGAAVPFIDVVAFADYMHTIYPDALLVLLRDEPDDDSSPRRRRRHHRGGARRTTSAALDAGLRAGPQVAGRASRELDGWRRRRRRRRPRSRRSARSSRCSRRRAAPARPSCRPTSRVALNANGDRTGVPGRSRPRVRRRRDLPAARADAHASSTRSSSTSAVDADARAR